MLLNKNPFLYASTLYTSSVRTLGVQDPNGEYFGISLLFDSDTTSGIRLNPTDITLETSTDYTVKFFARNKGAGSSVNLQLRFNNTANENQSFSVTSTDWTEYTHTFNSGTNTLLTNDSRINNQSGIVGLDLDFYCLRIYKTSEGDPLSDIENQVSTQNLTDFSEYTTGVAPADWTQFDGSDATAQVVADAGAEGGKYLEITRSSSGTEYFLWDDIDADANRANGQVTMKFRSDAGYGIAFRVSGTEGSVDSNIMAFTTGGLGNLDYQNGQISRLDEQDLNEVTFVANTYFIFELQFNYDAVLGRAWDASSGSRPDAPNVAVGALVTEAGSVGVANFSANSIDVDTFQFDSGTPWYTQSVSGLVTYNAAPVEGATVDLISVDQVGGAETVAEAGLTTQADGTVTSSVSRDGAKEYYFRVYPFNLPISGLTGTLTATDATNLDLGVDLSALDTGQNRAYTIKATGGTGSGEVILIKGYTDKANGLVTVDYHPFGNDTTFEVCRLISGENASVLPRTS